MNGLESRWGEAPYVKADEIEQDPSTDVERKSGDHPRQILLSDDGAGTVKVKGWEE